MRAKLRLPPQLRKPSLRCVTVNKVPESARSRVAKLDSAHDSDQQHDAHRRTAPAPAQQDLGAKRPVNQSIHAHVLEGASEVPCNCDALDIEQKSVSGSWASEIEESSPDSAGQDDAIAKAIEIRDSRVGAPHNGGADQERPKTASRNSNQWLFSPRQETTGSVQRRRPSHNTKPRFRTPARPRPTTVIPPGAFSKAFREAFGDDACTKYFRNLGSKRKEEWIFPKRSQSEERIKEKGGISDDALPSQDTIEKSGRTYMYQDGDATVDLEYFFASSPPAAQDDEQPQDRLTKVPAIPRVDDATVRSAKPSPPTTSIVQAKQVSRRP